MQTCRFSHNQDFLKLFAESGNYFLIGKIYFPNEEMFSRSGKLFCISELFLTDAGSLSLIIFFFIWQNLGQSFLKYLEALLKSSTCLSVLTFLISPLNENEPSVWFGWFRKFLTCCKLMFKR